MPRIERHPGLEICPNFASPHYDPLRTLITNTGATEEEAITQLTEAWNQENQARKEAWEQLDEEDQQAADEADRLARELEQNELDTARREREKKKTEDQRLRRQLLRRLLHHSLSVHLRHQQTRKF